MVDHILQLNSAPGIAEFVATHFAGASAPPAHQREESRLYLAPIASQEEDAKQEEEKGEKGKEKEEAQEKSTAISELAVYKCARVGLSLKRERDGLATFVGKHYRFTSRPAWMKKGKPNMIVGLYQQGVSAAEVQLSPPPSLVPGWR